MADRILNWYLEEVREGDTQGPTYCMDRAYSLPGVLRMHAARAPKAGDLRVDILVDGVSIFTNYPTLQKGQTNLDWWEDFDQTQALIDKETFVSLHVVQSAGAQRVTVSLELDAELGESDKELEE